VWSPPPQRTDSQLSQCEASPPHSQTCVCMQNASKNDCVWTTNQQQVHRDTLGRVCTHVGSYAGQQWVQCSTGVHGDTVPPNNMRAPQCMLARKPRRPMKQQSLCNSLFLHKQAEAPHTDSAECAGQRSSNRVPPGQFCSLQKGNSSACARGCSNMQDSLASSDAVKRAVMPGSSQMPQHLPSYKPVALTWASLDAGPVKPLHF
jgi:hypothetical protein